jgi:4-hydroxythreonine-4-phosphate dehydrogenase
MKQAAVLLGWKGRIISVGSPTECRFDERTLEVINCREMEPEGYPMGQVSAASGDLAFQAIRRAISDAQSGLIDATATAPINKEALSAAGHKFAGHTEIYAHYTGTDDYTMLLVEGNLRVAHVSTHVSLRQAVDLVKKDRIISVIKLVHEALIGMGIKHPHIAVAGLNPHAGEKGLFGREEIDEILPAIAETTELGAEGPYPPDTVFSRAAGGEFDSVVAMYHDQGHIAVKMAGFRYGEGEGPKISGINVTLGTPVIRCSVDHGTAFDRAWKGIADESSMLSAMVMAANMARKK